MESAPATTTSLDETPRLSNPLTYDGSALASTGASMIPHVEDHPIGYPRQAAFADSDESFAIYRRFGYIHARLLMHRQDEIRVLERELGDMDLKDNRDEDGQRCLRSREVDDRRSRREERGRDSRSALFNQIEEKLLKYGQLLQQSQALIAMNKPSAQEQDSLRNYIENRQCVAEAESKFAYHKEDLVTLYPDRDQSIIDGFIENLIMKFPFWPLQVLFCSKETASKSHDPRVHYFMRARFNAFVTVIIIATILILLVLPVWLLYHISVTVKKSRSSVVCMGILLVATLAFTAVLGLFTKAKRHEVLAASAGYCAVLVVFVGNISNAGIGGAIDSS